MSTVFAYYGSKNSIADEIVELMPAHRGYVEPFAGSLAVLRAKPASPFECVNDLDGDLMTFWRVLRDRFKDLERLAALTPHSRSEYDASWPIDTDDELVRAWRVWVKLSQGRGGQLRPTGWRYHEITRGRGSGMPTTLAGYVGRFAAAADRLRSVSLESLPALELIDRYGRDPQTLFYVDPPYLGDTRCRTGYQIEMHREDEHRELAEALRSCTSMVMVSGYAHPLYDDDLYAGWYRHEIAAYTGQSNNGAGHRTEVLWANVPIGEPHLFSTSPAAEEEA
ncbi:DNA adenine methylase [Pimelobacter simplex]|uniref:DNA adenine methylase n=1 Tax=Nocardioides simplex TaxID=2045 RepID=A0A7J5DQL8_NOCSI|nr:DNA adenine methylase [Pimelobacter simplex]KAB2806964.1 DNA adenine methylase [Pimelobacter simplex]